MSKTILLKKVTSYFLFYVASTLFFYYFVSAGLYPYSTTLADPYSLENLLQNIYLPVIFAVLSFAVALVSQFLLLKIGGPYEERIYGISLLVFFGVYFLFALVILILTIMHPSLILSLSLIPAFLVSLGEITLGIVRLVDSYRATKEDEEAVAQTLQK
jgi:hypothetical protein